MTQIFSRFNYIIIVEPTRTVRIPKSNSSLEESDNRIDILSSREDYNISKSDVSSGTYVDEQSSPYTLSTLIEFLEENTSFKGAGDSSAITTTNFGFIDYNHNGSSVILTADTWTDVPNNGLGEFTNKTYKPSSVNELLDVSTGYLDFSELSLGSQITIRNDFTITPNTNNALLEARYLLGGGVGQYALQFLSERLDSGSGIPYQRVTSFPIYMGDLNTQGNAGILQVKLSTAGTFSNAGSYIDIKIR